MSSKVLFFWFFFEHFDILLPSSSCFQHPFCSFCFPDLSLPFPAYVPRVVFAPVEGFPCGQFCPEYVMQYRQWKDSAQLDMYHFFFFAVPWTKCIYHQVVFLKYFQAQHAFSVSDCTGQSKTVFLEYHVAYKRLLWPVKFWSEISFVSFSHQPTASLKHKSLTLPPNLKIKFYLHFWISNANAHCKIQKIQIIWKESKYPAPQFQPLCNSPGKHMMLVQEYLHGKAILMWISTFFKMQKVVYFKHCSSICFLNNIY